MAMRLSLTTYVIPGDRYYRKLASNVRFIDATSQKPNETVCGHAPETHSDRSRAEIIRCLRKGAPCSSWQYCRCWLLHYFLDKSPRRIRHGCRSAREFSVPTSDTTASTIGGPAGLLEALVAEYPSRSGANLDLSFPIGARAGLDSYGRCPWDHCGVDRVRPHRRLLFPQQHFIPRLQ